ncbi:hypothetical protein SAMN04488128_1011769 [Chitinophaga eiseniae]|uniref:Uncharacterized protein n=1 Tax=Chitinophaga eiseniae TaxID=634771 RepID=A0A1T4NUT7_9BACT|nr:hypothetical protein [Chitinophaga eiseniae]SJZ83120.1 hypothetical protein SAMN04488128_1011769 [Chitinophaga eiseniae]
MKKRKKYDAVAEVRKIREEMSVKYFGNHDLLLKDLKTAWKEFHLEEKALRKR